MNYGCDVKAGSPEIFGFCYCDNSLCVRLHCLMMSRDRFCRKLALMGSILAKVGSMWV